MAKRIIIACFVFFLLGFVVVDDVLVAVIFFGWLLYHVEICQMQLWSRLAAAKS